jgi:hypothetical protein
MVKEGSSLTGSGDPRKQEPSQKPDRNERECYHSEAAIDKQPTATNPNNEVTAWR